MCLEYTYKRSLVSLLQHSCGKGGWVAFRHVWCGVACRAEGMMGYRYRMAACGGGVGWEP